LIPPSGAAVREDASGTMVIEPVKDPPRGGVTESYSLPSTISCPRELSLAGDRLFDGRRRERSGSGLMKAVYSPLSAGSAS